MKAYQPGLVLVAAYIAFSLLLWFLLSTFRHGFLIFGPIPLTAGYVFLEIFHATELIKKLPHHGFLIALIALNLLIVFCSGWILGLLLRVFEWKRGRRH